MASSIRPATPRDTPAIVALLSEGAAERRSLDPVLWRIAADAAARIETAVRGAFATAPGSPPEFGLVAEHAARIVGVTHAMLVPVPPIYDSTAGAPGLLLDDCVIASDAPPATAANLLAATEAELTKRGAPRLIASCSAGGRMSALYERHGYAPVTLYMAKHRLGPVPSTTGVRHAGADDVPGIVARSARHRKMLAEIGPGFWHIHPEANQRFERWMRHSLTLTDRDMFVAPAAGAVRGYAIAQPIAPLLVPTGHDSAAIGVIDDFYDADFADVETVSNGGSSALGLLAAAEGAFARRGVDSILVVCPAAWPSKVALLEQSGYRTAKLWMLKR